MTPFSELAISQEYWLTKIQNELYDSVEQYRERRGWTRTQLAEYLGYTKGYVSQILNGDFDHKLSKLIELSLAVGVVPNIRFQATNDYVTNYLNNHERYFNDAKAAAIKPAQHRLVNSQNIVQYNAAWKKGYYYA